MSSDAAGKAIDALFVVLGLDTKNMDKGIKSAEASLNRFAARAAKFLTAAFASQQFLKGFENFRQNMTSLGDVATRLNSSIKTIDAWGGAVEAAGGSAQGLYSTLDGLEKKLFDATKFFKGDLIPYAQHLGISLYKSGGGAKSATDLLLDLAKVAERMDARTFRHLAGNLGLDEGTIRLLLRGTDAVKNLVDEMSDYAYSDEDKKAVKDYNAAVKRLGRSWNKTSAIIFSKVLPYGEKLLEDAEKFVKFLRGHEGFVIGLIGIVGAAIVGWLTKIAVAALRNPMTWLFLVVGAAILSLLIIFEDLYTYLQGGDSYWEDFWKDSEKEINRVIDLVKELRHMISDPVDYFWNGKKTIDENGEIKREKPLPQRFFKGISGWIWDTLGRDLVGAVPEVSFMDYVFFPSIYRKQSGGGGNMVDVKTTIGEVKVYPPNGDVSAIAGSINGAVFDKSAKDIVTNSNYGDS